MGFIWNLQKRNRMNKKGGQNLLVLVPPLYSAKFTLFYLFIFHQDLCMDFSTNARLESLLQDAVLLTDLHARFST